MSSLLNSNFSKRAVSWGACLAPIQRHLHRSADFTYSKIWQQGQVDFCKEMGEAGENLHQSPSLVERIFKTMSAMNEKGYTPFLHAMPASAQVVKKFNAVVHPPDDPNYKYLRSPSDPAFSESLEDASKKVPAEGEQRSDLLSMSYGLTSGIKSLESAASWGFRNYFGGKEQNFPMGERYKKSLEEGGLEPHSEPYNHFWHRGRNLIQDYNRLNVGNFMVVGVPNDKVDQFTYDSKPYNIPTGEKASDVAADPERYKQSLMDRGTHMATMRLCRETLSSDSGIRTVDVQNEKEVDLFCSDMEFRKMSDIPEYKGLVSSQPTRFEQSETERRKALDRQLEELAKDFESYRRTPTTVLASSQEEESRSFDCEWLP